MDLADWLGEDPWVLSQQPIALAGQTGIQFDSTGLYEHRSVLVPTADGQHVVRVTVALGNLDDEAAFDTVIDSLKLVGEQP